VFRAFEEATTAELLDVPGVLALGGGAVLSAATRSALRGHHVVWLQVEAGEAASRVGLNTARPLLLGNVRGRLVQLLAQRRPLYAEVATLTVDTDDVPPELVVDLILEQLSTGDALRQAQGTSSRGTGDALRQAQGTSSGGTGDALRQAQGTSSGGMGDALRQAQGTSSGGTSSGGTASTRPEPVEGQQ
jgi:hypothetical protein